MCSSIYVGILFAICTGLLVAYPIGKRLTIQIADELSDRRKQFASGALTETGPEMATQTEG